jgi:hypothetical protein
LKPLIVLRSRTMVTSLPIRGDLARAHDAQWARLGRPGTWLTGEERVAVATEARAAASCPLCYERQQALSPRAVARQHDASSQLSAAEVDAVHRIAVDCGRLTRDWFDALGLAPERYVEILSVTAHTVGMDTFCRAVGHPLRPLPAPAPGPPTRRSVGGGLDRTSAWVPVRRVPGVPFVLRALSLVPDEVAAMEAAAAVEYLPAQYVPDARYVPDRSLTRSQIEFIAVRTSLRNRCFY